MLCSEGVSGKAIMEALVANSATFHTKTAFSQVLFCVIVCYVLSFLRFWMCYGAVDLLLIDIVWQEKYLRKKQKKYAPRVVVKRPSARRLNFTLHVYSYRELANQ